MWNLCEKDIKIRGQVVMFGEGKKGLEYDKTYIKMSK